MFSRQTRFYGCITSSERKRLEEMGKKRREPARYWQRGGGRSPRITNGIGERTDDLPVPWRAWNERAEGARPKRSQSDTPLA
ncbi:hypothetical protein Y032_0205g1953 [Ancylostoma ceylanicum]|uniref:Uncharacterized protein n=1 Tax=Ancylostoma ceylanicum TaxID=53326 RepID=A0A016SMH1_9BILA|nr:hypothetical protein Y032_0205g1953 [Ancylostoma ceylanicum]